MKQIMTFMPLMLYTGLYCCLLNLVLMAPQSSCLTSCEKASIIRDCFKLCDPEFFEPIDYTVYYV